MKPFLIIIIAVFLLSCQYTPQQRAEQIIKASLDSTLNDPKSYESIKFTKLDTVYSKLEDDFKYRSAKAKEDSIENAYSSWKIAHPAFDADYDLSHAQVVYFVKMIKVYTNQKVQQLKICNKIANDFKPKFEAWSIRHTYRAKNGIGALTIHTTDFEVDSAVSKVVSSIEEQK